MYPKSFKRLIDHFASLPSVGPRMAERLVLYLFKQDAKKLNEFSQSLSDLKANLHYCKRCFHLSEEEFCYICKDKNRDTKAICVVEDPLDIIALERTKKYNGLYHVLGGVLTPTQSPENSHLRFRELLERIKSEGTKEVILALNPTTEGDATAFYLMRMLKDYDIEVTRLARGLSTGSDIEHADELTLGSAIANRK